MTGRIELKDAIADVLQEHTVFLLASAKCLLGLLAGGDVAGDPQKAYDHPILEEGSRFDLHDKVSAITDYRAQFIGRILFPAHDPLEVGANPITIFRGDQVDVVAGRIV